MPHRLLLADDSVTIQRVIELTFAEEGVDVVSVGDGLKAIERLEAEHFDIVLADVGMPGKDGFEVAAFVRARPELAGVAVVLLTGAFETLDEARVAAVGAAAVLVKPFEPQMVIATVRDLLSGKPANVPVAASEALLEAPGSATTPTGSADDYFDRLDKAFATLNTSLEPRAQARPSARAPEAPEAPQDTLKHLNAPSPPAWPIPSRRCWPSNRASCRRRRCCRRRATARTNWWIGLPVASWSNWATARCAIWRPISSRGRPNAWCAKRSSGSRRGTDGAGLRPPELTQIASGTTQLASGLGASQVASFESAQFREA